MNHNIIIVSLLGILFVGCSSKPQIDINETPKLQVNKKVIKPVKRKGALYSREGSSLFADKKDLQIGDIIQVLISESLDGTSTNTREMKKSNSSDLGGGLFTPPVNAGDTTATRVNKLNNSLGVGFKSSTSNTFKGSSKSATTEEFTTTISAIVEKVYQNGNYFIKGTKEMLINGQKQNIKLSGVIRPYDINTDNSIYSNQIANLKILYEKDGEENDVLEKSWGTKFIETIWPF